ncbi:MAG: nodulation protein NfeD [Chloroflexi bacterium]|nr:nodulation protein NfeD [Chloroflexota bacterium]
MRRTIWVVIAGFGIAMLSISGFAFAKDGPPPIPVAEVTGVINPLTADYLVRAIDEAEREGAPALVIRVDTPGGLDSAMRTMVQAVLGSRVPVIVYVAPSGARAASAGLFLAMSAHIAAMAPGTNIGAAHPVSLGGQPSDPTMTDKVVSDSAAYMRSLAETRGRNKDWGERAVRESVSASSSEALTLGIIEIVADDLPSLLRAVDGRTVKTAAGTIRLATAGSETVDLPMNPIEQLLHIITDPDIALVLLSIGTVGILAELYHPGMFFPGIGGVISLVLAWVALGSLPTNWAGAGLLMLGFFLFVVEAHNPTVGAFAGLGAISFVLGAMLLFRPIGSVSPSAAAIDLNPLAVIAVGAGIVAFTLIVLRAVQRIRKQPALSGSQTLMGRLATAVGNLNPRGQVRLGGEDWTADTTGRSLLDGETVRVVGISGVILRVEPVSDPPVLLSPHSVARPAPSTESGTTRREG